MNKYLQFDDLQDFWAYSFRESNARIKSSRKTKSDWYGNVSWEEAKTLAVCGWFEGLEEISKVKVELSEMITSKIEKQFPEYGIAGGILDVATFLTSDPEYFLVKAPVEFEQSGKIIKIVCSVSFSSAIESSVIIQRGIMICALVDALEMSGYRCEIFVNGTFYYSKAKLEIEVCLKKASQSLSMIEAAFCLAHPAMWRRMMFSVAELEGWSDFAHAYGKPGRATNTGDLYINEIFSKEVPNAKAVEWVIEQLKTFGIKIIK